MRFFKFLLFILIFLKGFVEANASCSLALDVDKAEFLKKIYWQEGWPNIERRPPPLFSSKLQVLVTDFMVQLPEGIPLHLRKTLERFFKLLRDPSQTYDSLKDLDSELAQENSENKRRERLEQMLSTYEKRYGFAHVVVKHHLDWIELARKLSRGEIFSELSERGLQLALSSNVNDLAAQGHWLHPDYAHRLQLHFLLRDYEKNPHFYDSAPLEAYQALGSEELKAQNLIWQNTGIISEGENLRQLFFQLLDSDENNGSSPGFYFEYRRFWPSIPLFN